MLLFLKLYDGFPHLVSFDYIWAVFGFFWQVDPRYFCLNIDVGVSCLYLGYFWLFWQVDQRVDLNIGVGYWYWYNVGFGFIDKLISYIWNQVFQTFSSGYTGTPKDLRKVWWQSGSSQVPFTFYFPEEGHWPSPRGGISIGFCIAGNDKRNFSDFYTNDASRIRTDEYKVGYFSIFILYLKFLICSNKIIV